MKDYEASIKIVIFTPQPQSLQKVFLLLFKYTDNKYTDNKMGDSRIEGRNCVV